MCGIAGVLDPRRSRDGAATAELLRTMADQMRFRGPDASGEWVDPERGVGLGHVRLSIVDLSEHGAQPMVSSDGRWVLTYNGEIYNHGEVAAELAGRGMVFRGHSDTEVLVEAIASWGLAETLERIDGMYAFALWDRQLGELTLVCDRMGEKPLCYATLPTGEVVFASTLDALAVHPAFDATVDRQALALFFRYKCVPAPFTIYQGVRKLEPGCTVTIRSDGTVGAPESYWRYFDAVRGPRFDGTPEDAVMHLDALLRRSVRRRMVADVPVGAFLSGGIDSSAVVAAAQAESARPVQTFTIGSPHQDFDESSDARAVATRLGTDHTELIVSDQDALAVVDQLGGMHDEPFADSSQVPTRLVSELARRDVTVVLSGDGGDELFGGYNRYMWVPTVWKQMGRVPRPARRVVGRGLQRVPPVAFDRAAVIVPKGRRPRMLGLKVSKVAGVLDADSEYEVFHRLVSHWQDPSALVRGVVEPPTVHTTQAAWPAVNDLVEHMGAVDAVTYLPDDILVKLDRAAMSVSLEGRIPLLDRDIVEFAASLPTEVKLRDGVSKWPLRSVLGRYLPADLFDRPKSGFGLPIETWLQGPLKEWAADRLFSPLTRSFVDVGPVRRLWDDHQSGRRNGAYELWDVIMFAEWAERRGVEAEAGR
jgi:asparagine synthase (glutamine-hydrolysing)